MLPANSPAGSILVSIESCHKVPATLNSKPRTATVQAAVHLIQNPLLGSNTGLRFSAWNVVLHRRAPRKPPIAERRKPAACEKEISI
jgi:hypothetical protein